MHGAPRFVAAPNRSGRNILIVSHRIEGGVDDAGRMVSVPRDVRFGTGSGNFDRCDFPCGGAPVPCGVFAHWLRLCLYAQVRKEVSMKIVIVKSPKFLAGILRMLFGIRE